MHAWETSRHPPPGGFSKPSPAPSKAGQGRAEETLLCRAIPSLDGRRNGSKQACSSSLFCLSPHQRSCNALWKGSLCRFGHRILANHPQEAKSMPSVSGPLRGEASAGGLLAARGGGLQIFPVGSAPWQPPDAGIPPCPPSGSQDFQERHWPPASLGPRRSGRSRLENSEQILTMFRWKSGQGWKSQSTVLFAFWAWPGRKDEGFPRADGVLANGSPGQLAFAFSHPTDLLGAKSQPVGATPLGPDPRPSVK